MARKRFMGLALNRNRPAASFTCRITNFLTMIYMHPRYDSCLDNRLALK
jgi:hypothetical protein